MTPLNTEQTEQVAGAARKLTTLAIGEEGKRPIVTTMMVGEEGGPIATTLALGEEGGAPTTTTTTTMALGSF
jgi:hypothetical protein